MAPVVVVGAGLAGLAAACRLVGDGHDVTVVERGPEPGGLAGRIRRDGWSFDTGPTVLTMPGLLADTLRAAGTEMDDVLTIRQLDPAYRARFADGSTIDVPAGRDRFRAEIAGLSGEHDAAGFDRFADWLTELYDAEMPSFIDRNFDGPWDLLSSPGALARLVRLGGFGKLDTAVARYVDDTRLQRLFSFQALYAGLDPRSALALYAVITYMDTVAGVYHCDGGMHAIPVAMADAVVKAGGVMRYDAEVTDILWRSGGRQVAGVQLAGGEQLRADAVVVAIGRPAAARLVTGRTPRRIRPVYSPSAVVWHVGVRGVPDGAAHHNIHFGDDWDGAFDDLIGRRRLMADPSRLVSVPSLTDPSLAPQDGSTLYVLEPVPNNTADIDWRRQRPVMRERLLEFLQANRYPADVVTEELVTPLDWQQRGLTAGTPFSLAHTFGQTGPFRPRNVTRSRPGVVYAGAGTVPGVGVPMVLISGRLAALRVAEHLGSSNTGTAQ